MTGLGIVTPTIREALDELGEIIDALPEPDYLRPEYLLEIIRLDLVDAGILALKRKKARPQP